MSRSSLLQWCLRCATNPNLSPAPAPVHSKPHWNISQWHNYTYPKDLNSLSTGPRPIINIADRYNGIQTAWPAGGCARLTEPEALGQQRSAFLDQVTTKLPQTSHNTFSDDSHVTTTKSPAPDKSSLRKGLPELTRPKCGSLTLEQSIIL